MAGIVLLAVFLRFAIWRKRPLVEAIDSGRWQLHYPNNHGREGLFINTQGVFVKALMTAFGDREGFLVQP